jgi:hypothetical protein
VALRRYPYFWAKDMLKRNEQLKSKLRTLATNETICKALNQICFKPGFAMPPSAITHRDKSLEGVRNGLKALEDLKFHS